VFLQSHFLFVLDQGQKIKSNLTLGVLLDSYLDLLPSLLKPVAISDVAEANGTWLQAVEFVEFSSDWKVRNEVENIIIFFSNLLVIFLNRKWILPCKAVMGFSDNIWVSNGPSFIFRIESCWETLYVAKFGSNIDLVIWLIQKNWQKSLGSTGVVDNLVGKEQVLVIVT